MMSKLWIQKYKTVWVGFSVGVMGEPKALALQAYSGSIEVQERSKSQIRRSVCFTASKYIEIGLYTLIHMSRLSLSPFWNYY